MLANSLPHYEGTDDSLTQDPTTNVGPCNVHILTAPPRHGVHTSLSATISLFVRPPTTVADGGLGGGGGTNASEHAQLRQQEINLLCERALALDAHGRICLGDCLRHWQRRVE